MDVILRELRAGASEAEVEIVEHKGIGHPDTICDALAESFALALARFYTERFGSILHFNVDKALLVGGESRPAFGGGRVIQPIQVFLAGRATRDVRGVPVPVEDIARESSMAWVREHMHALEPERHVVWNCLVRGGSTDLVDLFLARDEGSRASWLANDTSVGAGHAPLSSLERGVLAAADRLRQLARERPEVGEDTKIMGVRREHRIRLTVACAFIGRHLRDIDDYAARRVDIAGEVATAARNASGCEVSVDVNVGDDLPSGRVYLTVTGTSAEAGDDGQVGRGNRVGGLITPYRPMSLEAAAGKNPVSHVGKLYNVLAQRIAAAVVERAPEVLEAHCVLLGHAGARVDQPALVDVQVRRRDGVQLESVRRHTENVVREALGGLGTVADEILARRIRLF